MSLFFALDLSAPVRTQVAAAQHALKPTLDAKWARPEGLHVTLVFMGEVAEPARSAAQQAAAQVTARHRAFTLQVASAGVFGHPPRILWLGVAGQLDALHALQAELATALHIKDEHGSYHPHLTLARARPARGDPALRPAAQGLEEFVSADFEVRSVTLYESAGGRYRALAQLELTGETAGPT